MITGKRRAAEKKDFKLDLAETIDGSN